MSAGAVWLQFSPEKRDSYPPGKAKLSKLALALDAVSEMAARYDLKILMPNAMHRIVQTADELEFTLLQCKSKSVGMMLDLAMMQQSGTRPEEFIRKMGKRLACIRFNDLSRPVKGFAGSQDRNYRIESPGKGNSLNYPEIKKAITGIKFKGIGLLSCGTENQDVKSRIKAMEEARAFWNRC